MKFRSIVLTLLSGLAFGTSLAATPIGASDDSNGEVKQIIEIHQVISQTATKTGTTADTKYTGVNGATWSVYDVSTDLSKQIGIQKSTTDIKSTASQLEKALTQKVYTISQYQKVATGKTQTIGGIDGLFDVPITVPANKYQALLFQNDSVPNNATKASQFVLIVPLSDDTGKIPAMMVIQPKSSAIAPAKTIQQNFPQTGDHWSWILVVIGVLGIIATLVMIFGAKQDPHLDE